MDIRVQAYGPTHRPTAVTTFRGPNASISVTQSAAERGPVPAVAALNPYRGGTTGGTQTPLTAAQRQMLAEETGLGRVIDRYV